MSTIVSATADPPSSIERPDPQRLSDLVDRLASSYANDPRQDEIVLARREYAARRGQIFEDEDLFARYVSAFLEWYVIERPLAGGPAPVNRELVRCDSDADRALLRALAWSHRSLFEVERVDQSGAYLTDLIGGGRWRVIGGGEGTTGLTPAEVLEARLLPWAGEVILGPVALFHPPQAHAAVHALLERRRQEGRLASAVVCELAGMLVLFGRVRNIAVERIYVA